MNDHRQKTNKTTYIRDIVARGELEQSSICLSPTVHPLYATQAGVHMLWQALHTQVRGNCDARTQEPVTHRIPQRPHSGTTRHHGTFVGLVQASPACCRTGLVGS